MSNGKIGRNEQCSCGSNKKWKKCHGKIGKVTAEEVRSFKSIKDLTSEDLYKVFLTCASIKYGMTTEELLERDLKQFVSHMKKADKNKHSKDTK